LLEPDQVVATDDPDQTAVGGVDLDGGCAQLCPGARAR
jgi:hypothetical protein